MSETVVSGKLGRGHIGKSIFVNGQWCSITLIIHGKVGTTLKVHERINYNRIVRLKPDTVVQIKA